MYELHITSKSGALYAEGKDGIIEDTYEVLNNRNCVLCFGDTAYVDWQPENGDDVWYLIDLIKENYYDYTI